jgi:WD40 repeat protein
MVSLPATVAGDNTRKRRGCRNTNKGKKDHATARNANKGKASASSDKAAAIWKTVSGELLQRLKLSSQVNNLAFSHNDKRLLVELYNEPTQVWDLIEGKLTFVLANK